MASVTGSPPFSNNTCISMHCPATHSMVATVLPPILITELIVGLPGTMVALWIFCFQLRYWKPNTLFLFNLVVADFLLLISVPFRIDNLIRGEYWVFGPVWCRINLFMLAVNRSSSIAFMTVVAVDRYFKVVHPHHRINRITVTQAGRVSGMIWAVVLALRLPLLGTPLLCQHHNTSLCRSFSSYNVTPPALYLNNMVYTSEFFLPLLMLIFCSLRITCFLRRREMDKNRKVQRAIRAVGAIVGVFIFCFMPSIVFGLTSLAIKVHRPNDCKSYQLMTELFSMSIGFTYMNSTLDPVIYCFSSSMFRDALKRMFNRVGVMEMRMSRRNSTTSDG